MKRQSIFNVIIVLMTIKSNSGLIPASDFYNDQTPVSTSSDGFDDCDNSHSGDLPKSITNIRGDPSTVYQSYRNIEDGQFPIRHDSSIYNILVWYNVKRCFDGETFETTISTNAQLLQRARDDITSIFDVDPSEVTPDYLLIFQYNDARIFAAEGEGTTYQTVIATNGEYTYAIIQFASVESGLAGDDILALISSINLPYNSDPSQAGNEGTNPDIPGKYIIDLNDNPPPPPPPHCPSCVQRIELVACQLLRLKADSDGSTVPRPCQG